MLRAFPNSAMASSSSWIFFFSLTTFISHALLSSAQSSIINHNSEHSVIIPRSDDEIKVLFESWQSEHGKAYNAIHERNTRFEIFKSNLKFIDDHNSAGDQHSYKLGLNKFADLTNEEFCSMYLTKTTDLPKTPFSTKRNGRALSRLDVEASIPDSIDWRQRGAVGPIRDQGLCTYGSWAFSAAGALEATNQIATGKFTALSVQQLLDCVPGTSGCFGGNISAAFQFVLSNGGIATEAKYPRTFFSFCNKNEKSVSIDLYVRLNNDQNAIKLVLGRQPVSAVINAGSLSFQFYKSGIFNGDCGRLYSQSVLVVGYGNQKAAAGPGKIGSDVGVEKDYNLVKEGDYYILASSWGTGWGAKGYMQLQASPSDLQKGSCGIATDASHPVISSWKGDPEATPI